LTGVRTVPSGLRSPAPTAAAVHEALCGSTAITTGRVFVSVTNVLLYAEITC
jgi:hypothetical protein